MSQHELYSRVCGFRFPHDLANSKPTSDGGCSIPSDVIERVKQSVAKHLSPEGEILNLYIWGSRFYRNASNKSDYDLIAIVTGTPEKSSFYQPRARYFLHLDFQPHLPFATSKFL